MSHRKRIHQHKHIENGEKLKLNLNLSLSWNSIYFQCVQLYGVVIFRGNSMQQNPKPFIHKVFENFSNPKLKICSIKVVPFCQLKFSRSMCVCVSTLLELPFHIWLACATPFYIIHIHLFPQTNDLPSVDVEEIQKAWKLPLPKNNRCHVVYTQTFYWRLIPRPTLSLTHTHAPDLAHTLSVNTNRWRFEDQNVYDVLRFRWLCNFQLVRAINFVRG